MKITAAFTVFARRSLGCSFLSAVADRFGLWGAYGAPHVAWGNFERFTAYTAKLNWFAEAALGLLLIAGIFTRYAALASGLLLLLFAVSMTIALGIKSPLDFSVFSASAAAFLLATAETYPLSVDSRN